MRDEKMSYNIKRVSENSILSSCAPHLLANESKDGITVLLVEYEQTTKEQPGDDF